MICTSMLGHLRLAVIASCCQVQVLLGGASKTESVLEATMILSEDILSQRDAGENQYVEFTITD